jgi:hypothetical protein
MYSTTSLIRTGVLILLIAGSASACHYQAGTQYVDDSDVPGADSGTRRVSTTTMRSDSTSIPMDSAAIKHVDSTGAKSDSALKH